MHCNKSVQSKRNMRFGALRGRILARGRMKCNLGPGEKFISGDSCILSAVAVVGGGGTI